MDIALITLLGGAAENIFLYGVMFIVTLAIIISIHELGHYFAARICGVWVEQFSFGFGREVLGFGPKGKFPKTRFSICAIPIGGFVKIFGDVDINNPQIWDHQNNEARALTKDELKYSFCTKPLWQRSFIVLAGPLINFILFLTIIITLFTIHGERSQRPVITALTIGAPAEQAGIKIRDIMIEMDGIAINRLSDIYDRTFYEIPPKPHNYKLLRNNEEHLINFTPRIIEYTTSKGIDRRHGQTGMIQLSALKIDSLQSINGNSVVDNPIETRDILKSYYDQEITVSTKKEYEEFNKFRVIFPEKYNEHLEDPNHEDYDFIFTIDPDDYFYVTSHPIVSAQRALFSLKQIFINSYKMVSAVFYGKSDQKIVGGVGKMSQKTGEAVEAGFYDYFIFLAGLSLMIGALNLLPIPGLDGGYLLFFIYEALVGKPLNQRIQDLSLIVGLLVLGGIMVFANASDLILLWFE